MTTFATSITLFVVPIFSLVLLPILSSLANPRIRTRDLDLFANQT